MILKSIRLKNFISHRDSKIEFPLGVVAIIGPNGAGKTSILDAISFALFKDTSRGKTYENILHRGSNVAEVELEFIHGNKQYRLNRKITKTGKRVGVTSRLYVDGKLRMFGEREIDREIERIIAIDRNIFSSTIYIRQGEIERLVTARPHERKELISKLLRIHDLEKAWREMLSIIKVYEERLRGIEDRLKKKDEIKDKLENKKKHLKRLIEELIQTERELKLHENKLEDIKRIVDKYDKKKSIFIDIKVRLEEISKKKDLLEKELEKYEEEYKAILEAKEKIQEMKERLEVLEVLNEYKGLLERRKMIKEQLEVFRMRLDEYGKMLHRLHELELILNRYPISEEKLSFIESKVKESEMLKGKILTIKETLKEYEYFLKSKREQLRQLLNRIGIGKETDLETIRTKYEDLLKMLNEEEYRLSNTISRLTKLMGMLEYRAEYVEQIKHGILSSKKCPVCSSNIEDRIDEIIQKLESERKNAMSSRARIEKELRKMESRLEKVREESKNILSVSIDTISKMLEEILDLEGKRKDLLEELSGIENLVRGLDKWKYTYTELSSILKEVEAARYEYNILMKKLGTIADPVDLVDKIKELEHEEYKVNNRLEYLETEYHIDPSSIDARISELTTLKEKYEKLNKTVANLDLFKKLIEEKKNLKSKLLEEEKELMKKLELLDYDEDKHNKMIENMRLLEEKIKDLIAKVGSVKSKIDSVKSEIEELEKEWRDIKELEHKYMKLTKLVEVLKEIRALYSKDQLQRDIRNIAKPIIERYTKEYFDCFGLDYYDVKLDEDFNIYLIGQGGVYPISAISGGERIALSLALRMAIARALAGGALSFMMMDEPTVHLDEVRRRQLTKMIRRGVKHRGLSQLIVVTHDRELEDVADIVYRVQRSGAFSVVTRA